MSQPTIEDLLTRNKTIHPTHTPFPTFSYLRTHPSAIAKTLIIACADPRSDPAYIFSLKPGEAVILRNAGGQVTPLLNDILALDTLLSFKEVVIIHHTDCGTTHFTNELVRSALLARNVEAAEAAGVADVDFGAICDLRGSVARDVRFLRGCGLVRETLSIRGFIYDIETGSVEEMGVF